MKQRKETENVQNTLAVLIQDVYLNVNEPNIKLKRQYHKATEALARARHEFDVLNDIKNN